MNVVRQSMRPKHQVLVLKCYPHFQKGVADVKPNPSELSYLLYYASTRRSKVQKVGAYLEKKSTSDVSRGKVGNVQVTLHILRALIDKSPRDLPLYAPYVLRILTLILGSNDLTMVEESVPAFQSFCENQDAATLSASQQLTGLFESIVKSYASFAGEAPIPSKTPLSAPVAIRWKTAGLQAIKSVTASEAIGTDGGRQLAIVMPIILENLYSDGEDRLVTLNQRAQFERESAIKRRMSIATVRTAESSLDPDNTTVSATTADADRLAEEEAGLLALQSLKQVYSANNRGQIRTATSLLLDFLIKKIKAAKSDIARPDVARPETARPETARTGKSTRTGNWTTTLVEIVTKWTPVQDRFVIMITVMEDLVRSPVTEENMEKQLVLASLIEWLLSSTINMIGLSVMDLLLGLIQHILQLLQLSSRGANALPYHPQTSTIDLFKPPQEEQTNRSSVMEILNNHDSVDIQAPSVARQQLLNRMRKCIGNLATHIYYSDQVHDIISAVLLRLKPSSHLFIGNTAAAIEKPAGIAQAISGSLDMNEGSGADEFFSFGTARVTALNAIKDVLLVANKRGVVSGAGAVGRNRVGVKVWEGTQWLLRDEDRRVRRAYVDALLTWLRLEMSKRDLRAIQNPREVKKRKKAGASTADAPSVGAPGSLSSASRGGRSKMAKSSFLQLLHLAVYENALESPERESDILILHLLLTSLVQKLGVNAAKTGLPMISRLQGDIDCNPAIKTPNAKVNIGSLVHGYFWALNETFDLDTTTVGFEINSEISRRQTAGLWLDALQMPPVALELIVISGPSDSQQLPSILTRTETLRPFDHINAMVDQIAKSYISIVSSPPSSPPTSPGRVFAAPLVSAVSQRQKTEELPNEFKEAMCFKWSREMCIASAEKATARTISPNGSRSGTSRSAPNGLLAATNHTPRESSPAGVMPNARFGDRIENSRPPQPKGKVRQSSGRDSGHATPVSSSEHTHTLRVDDLKRVLAGGALADAFAAARPHSSIRTASPLRNTSTAYQDFGDPVERNDTRPSIISAGSDSVVDAEGFESASEGDLEQALPIPQSLPTSNEITQQHITQTGRRAKPDQQGSPPSRPSTGREIPLLPRPTSRGGTARPRSSSEGSAEDPEANARALKGQLVPDVVRGSIVGDEGVPPVPPLPEGVVATSYIRQPVNGSAATGNGTANSNTIGNGNGNSNGRVGASAKQGATAAPNNGVPPPLEFVPVNNTITAENARLVRDGSQRGSIRDSLTGSVDRGSLKGSDGKMLVQALLGSIEVGEVGGGGRGIGRPPY